MEHATKQPLSSSSHQPSCNHIFHTQTHHSPLPPLYTTPSLSTSTSTSLCQQPTLRPSTISKLTRALTTLGKPHTHTPFLNHDIIKLRKELEAGMSRERRQVMQFYILGIRNARKRAAAELYLARYKGFVLNAEGRLGYGLDEGVEGSNGEMEGGRAGDSLSRESGVEGQARKSVRERVTGCGVM